MLDLKTFSTVEKEFQSPKANFPIFLVQYWNDGLVVIFHRFLMFHVKLFKPGVSPVLPTSLPLKFVLVFHVAVEYLSTFALYTAVLSCPFLCNDRNTCKDDECITKVLKSPCLVGREVK